LRLRKCCALFATDKLRDFYQKLNPSKTGVAQQLAERYVGDLDALSASLRSKYGGLDLSSSTEDISAFAQNTSTQQSEKGLRPSSTSHQKVAAIPVRNGSAIFLTSVHHPQEQSRTKSYIYQTANVKQRRLHELMTGLHVICQCSCAIFI
jgi:hypothetical protein